jgi:hypothetical protein
MGRLNGPEMPADSATRRRKSPTLKKREWGTLICLRPFRPGHPSIRISPGLLITPASEDAPFENHKECGTPSGRLMVGHPPILTRRNIMEIIKLLKQRASVLQDELGKIHEAIRAVTGTKIGSGL